MLIPVLRRIGGALLVLAGVGSATCIALAFVPSPSEASLLERIGTNLDIFFTLEYGGRSLLENRPVMDVVSDRAAKSGVLIGGALLLVMGLGVPIGVWAALRPWSRLARASAGLLRSLSVVPVLILGVAVVAIATEGFGLPPFRQVLGLAGGGAVLAIYLLPMLTLAFGDGLLGDVMRTVETETARTTAQPWYRAAKARGVSLRRHLTRRLLPPTTAVLASKAAYLVSGSVVVEYVFGWQGLGYLMLNALVQAGPKDYALVLAATTLMVGIVVLLDMASAVVALAADPQRREG